MEALALVLFLVHYLSRDPRFGRIIRELNIRAE
jgi:hypothetical protein